MNVPSVSKLSYYYLDYKECMLQNKTIFLKRRR